MLHNLRLCHVLQGYVSEQSVQIRFSEGARYLALAGMDGGTRVLVVDCTDYTPIRQIMLGMMAKVENVVWADSETLILSLSDRRLITVAVTSQAGLFLSMCLTADGTCLVSRLNLLFVCG